MSRDNFHPETKKNAKTPDDDKRRMNLALDSADQLEQRDLGLDSFGYGSRGGRAP